jgi:DNA polymerase-3 subunit gamma/tau
MLSAAAFNALLKTLEEPPPHAIFILATTEEHKVPLTIKSRCQLFSFRLLTNQEIVGRLSLLAGKEDLNIEPEALTMIAYHGGGSMRDAESLLDQLILAPGDKITLDRAQLVLGTATSEAIEALTVACLDGDGPRGLTIIHDALSSGTDARQFSRQMVQYLRHLLLVKTAGRKLANDAPVEVQDRMVQLAGRSTRRQLIEAVKRFNEAAHIPAGIWQPQLPLELAFIELLPKAGMNNLGDQETISLEEDHRAATPEIVQPDKPVSVPEPSTEPKQIRESVQQIRPAIEEPTPVEDDISEGLTAPISIGQVQKNWQGLRNGVAKYDRSLPALLASCKPLATEGIIIFLGFDFPILKDKFDRKKNAKESVSKVLGQLLGLNCRIETVVTSDYSSPDQPEVIDKEAFSALAQELGGVVRENE